MNTLFISELAVHFNEFIIMCKHCTMYYYGRRIKQECNNLLPNR